MLDHGFVRLVDHMGNDLSVVRAARVSYNAAWRAGADEDQDERLLHYLWKNHHTTPFEAVTFTFEVKAPIFVFRQWHRHRTWCLTGDTMISFELPDRIKRGKRTAKKLRLDDFYRKWQPTIRKHRPERQTNAMFTRERIRKMLLRVFDEQNQEFTVGHIEGILFSGEKPVFEIALANGKTLKCSRDHRLLTDTGWQRLEDAVGLVVRGATAGMTKNAYVMTNGYVESTAPWNKGVIGYKTSRVVTEAEKVKIRAARSGPRSNFWKGGVSSERANIGRWTREQAPKAHAKYDYTCQDCGKRGGKLHAHHVKSVVSHPELARDFHNLISLCAACHQKRHGQTGECRMARGQILRAKPSKIVSIRYVGVEPTYDISVKGPHHNFVANGMVVHNSYNELSARYRKLPEEFYMPAPEMVGQQSKSSKQARDISADTDEDLLSDRKFQARLVREHGERAFALYRDLLVKGWPRELARSVLPVATYNHMFGTVNLLNLLKFLTLRCDSHAQYEIRVYAEAMRELIRPIVPVCLAAWESTLELKPAA